MGAWLLKFQENQEELVSTSRRVYPCDSFAPVDNFRRQCRRFRPYLSSATLKRQCTNVLQLQNRGIHPTCRVGGSRANVKEGSNESASHSESTMGNSSAWCRPRGHIRHRAYLSTHHPRQRAWFSNRAIKACHECRTRKAKCDKNEPKCQHHRECIYIIDKPDTISRDSVSRIKDLDIQKASGLTYHGSRVSFDFLHMATTSKIMIALNAVVIPYQVARETVGGFSILMEAHLRAINAEKRRGGGTPTCYNCR